MKQEISVEQYAELPEKHQLYFLEWMEKRGYSHLATIGQMIEFLHTELSKNIHINNDKRNKNSSRWRVTTYINNYYSEELCDAMWSAVVEVLKNS